jgi:uncharacterized protein YqgC (DUF456 family)
VITGAVALIALGVAGLVLPVIPGVVLLLAALALLTREFEWARSVLNTVRGVGQAPDGGRSSGDNEAD